MNRPPVQAQHQPTSPLLFNAVASMLEERKNFGDRRRSPDHHNIYAHPLTERRRGKERRQNFLNKEIFDRGRQSQEHH